MEAGDPARPQPRSLTIDEIAALLRVSRRSVYNYIREGYLTTCKLKIGGMRIVQDLMLQEQRSRLGDSPTRGRRRVRGNHL